MNDSPLFVKTYDLLKYLISTTEKFPKSQRFVLAERVRNAAMDFYEYLLEARKVGLLARRDVLLRADIELEKLRIQLRLSMEMEYLKFPQYEHASGYIMEIGRMLGSWREGTERKIAQAVPAS